MTMEAKLWIEGHAMCEICHRAVSEQEWERLDEIAADTETNCWLTRCPCCGQLWETFAYQPLCSWKLAPEEAKRKYPGSSI